MLLVNCTFSGVTLGKNPIFLNLKIKIQSFPSVEKKLKTMHIFPETAFWETNFNIFTKWKVSGYQTQNNIPFSFAKVAKSSFKSIQNPQESPSQCAQWLSIHGPTNQVLFDSQSGMYGNGLAGPWLWVDQSSHGPKGRWFPSSKGASRRQLIKFLPLY